MFMCHYNDDRSVSLTCGPGAPVSPFSPFIPNPGSPCSRTQEQWAPHKLASFINSICMQSCRLTLGPGIPCSPWKTLCTVSVKSEGEKNKLEVYTLYPDLDSDIIAHHGSRGPRWARWTRWAWLGDHLNLRTSEMTWVTQEQIADLT